MSLNTLSGPEVIARLGEFDALIDARSQAEYAEDHLPGAVNWPTLNDDQRHAIGILYTQVNPFEARKRGAAIAASNIAHHIERDVIDKPKDWRPLTYCWRGGQRSGALSLILSQIGFRVSQVEGGYKAFRAAVVQDIPRLVGPLDWRVIGGRTGCGKTRLLHALAAQGAQTLDLEALACHRSSVLGAIPGLAQPTQKRFDTLVWQTLRQMESTRPIFIESESKKVGNVTVPAALIEAMHTSPCLNLILPDAERVALLLEDYDFFVRDLESFCDRLEVLAEFKGKVLVARWQAQLRTGEIAAVVKQLLTQHYDPSYQASMRRNFLHFDTATTLEPHDHSLPAMSALASKIIKEGL